MKRGILLLGHGSRRTSANDGLETLARLVQAGLGMRVLPVFLQFEHPDLADGVERLAGEGVGEIIIVPALLFPGVHMREDIPAAIELLQARYGGKLRFVLTEGFGPDARLAEIVMERVHTAVANLPDAKAEEAAAGEEDDLTEPGGITSRSRQLIEESLGLHYLEQWPVQEGEVVRRVVHAMGNPDAAHLLRFHPAAVDAGLAAIRKGAVLFTDVRMVKMGINRAALREFGGQVVCMTHHPRVHDLAREQGLTRSMLGVRLVRKQLQDNVAVIGNAPTALAEVLRQSAAGFRPAMIVGTPVGFVGAAEVKARLAAQEVPYITMIGNQGGSTVAVSIVNALLALAQGKAGL